MKIVDKMLDIATNLVLFVWVLGVIFKFIKFELMVIGGLLLIIIKLFLLKGDKR